ncbi:Holliday junction branch migration protein RuvA [Methylocaldum szegediense]|uniref:Holliday junction branch migration complex subunit RuvA n=1 Tax=Methylocaldum szegediense TaxID=73780 RepID=A0ABM9I9S9_9GAMM|nr:Holliday junction branch migration protein RuvA [Methylocaldum szegediense]CAI8977117.1 Holliday junction branch migration complex subunit RuvA [Methylocaldum szegediense]
MIGFLRGVVVAKKPPSLLLDVRGVGYEIDAPMSTFYKLPDIGEEVMLYTHLAIREDAHNLFGFLSEAERALFRSLIRVSGVGAKLALAILSGLSAEEFHRCVEAQDTARLVRLPGVGKKTAERLIIEMRDRLPELPLVNLPGAGSLSIPSPSPVDDAVSALIALGFKPQDAHSLVRKVQVDGKSSEEIIRLALQSAAK